MWGGNAVAGRFAVGHISPLMLTGLRWAICVCVLVLVARPRLVDDWPVIRPRLPFLLVMGATGFAGFNALLYSALNHTTAINATILQAGMPMVIFALNFMVFRTRVGLLQAIGYTLTLLGVLLVAGRGSLHNLLDLALNPGDAIMLFAVLVYACYSVMLRSKPAIHWLSFMTLLALGALLASIPMMLYEVFSHTVIWPVTGQSWAVLLYTALLPALLGQALYIRGVELLGGNAAGLFINLVPIFGAVLSVALLGEQFHWYHGLALLTVIGGITIAQSRPLQARR